MARAQAAAPNRFVPLAPLLRRRLDDDRYELVHHPMDNLQFGEAAQVVASIRR